MWVQIIVTIMSLIAVIANVLDENKITRIISIIMHSFLIYGTWVYLMPVP